ncbi:MAG TPA: YjbE family putative metal transport protein [Candidatus Binataceae bacterium]
MNSTAAEAVRLFEIIGVNILLSGDNAVAVAMAIRNLPSTQGQIASAAGIGAATLLQIGVTLTLARLLKLPAVSLAGGLLLCVIAIRLTRRNAGLPHPPIHPFAGGGLYRSIMTVSGAYFVMCLDNIVGVAAVGRGHPILLIAGLLLSSAVIIPASLLTARLMRRYPATLAAGAGILGWVAGSMLAAVASRMGHPLSGPGIQFLIPALITVIVVTSPLWWRSRDRLFWRRPPCR